MSTDKKVDEQNRIRLEMIHCELRPELICIGRKRTHAAWRFTSHGDLPC